MKTINDKNHFKQHKDCQYILTMFPYPSGSGLHIGHYYNYALMDSYSRWLKYKGTEVFQPISWDSFGLPAENYAIKHNRDVKEVTDENIENFRNQFKRMNTGFEEKFKTSDPSYYKWTQWIFLKLKEKGLVYKKIAPVNYCSSCETVIANSQVIEDKCERCSTEIEMKDLNQWFIRITDYKDRLVSNLDWIDYPESTKKKQRNWMENMQDWCVSRQRKWGCPIPIDGEEDTLDTFVCSSFYYLRNLDPNNDVELFSKDKYKQVDLCVGGPEHATGHLIFARFINMFLYDIGIVPEEEPFKKVIHQGMINYNGEKMSKSKGNVINPDDYDPDELRMYLMFIGNYTQGGEWEDSKMKGIRKNISRMKIWLDKSTEDGENINTSELFDKIDGYMLSFKFNKVISSFMEFYNKNKNKIIDKESTDEIIKMYKCVAPGFNIK